MPGAHDRIPLEGFNNLTKAVRVNLYGFFVARTAAERERHGRWVEETFGAAQITAALREIAEVIDADVLSVSQQDYDPHGASALLLMGDRASGLAARDPTGAAGRVGVAAHLDKSHACAHTYPDWTDPRGICSLRVDIDIATCGTILPLRALDGLLRRFHHDVAIVDYVVRGFTRDRDGRRIVLDHAVHSIQDHLDPALREGYVCEDLVLQGANIWQTKLMRRVLDPAAHLPVGADPAAPLDREALRWLEQELAGVFYGWPS
jgi:S-adenosylmethionine decarboxylase